MIHSMLIVLMTYFYSGKLALLPLVKRQVYCVGDRLKMDKQKVWNNNFVLAPKLVRSPRNDR